MQQMNILIVGSLPPPLGGTSISLMHLVNSLVADKRVRLDVINTSGIRGGSVVKFFRLGNVFWHLLLNSKKMDVISLHLGIHALPILGPFAWLVSRLWGKPFFIRRFGGVDHRELTGFKLAIVDWVIKKSDLYLVQTLALVRSAREGGITRTVWFPTSRPSFSNHAGCLEKTCCQRFLFLSHVKPTKGIPELLAAAERMSEEVIVNVYGPFHDGLDVSIFAGCKRVRYCGVVPPEGVPEVLSQHDALLLPTYYEGEGYPGIILEAFGAGLPVISTRWKAIPEIVDESCGILIPTRDAEALREAIHKLGSDHALYSRLSKGALIRYRQFDLELWKDRFVSYCQDAIDIHRKHSK